MFKTIHAFILALLVSTLAAPGIALSAGKTIHELTADTNVTGTEELPVNDSSTDKRITVEQIRAGTTKAHVGLGNADNTSDASKPVSTAAQTALDAKVAITRTVNGHALSADVTVTKSDVGLGNADNTSDANKPVSTAAQTALDAKVASTRTISTAGLASGGGDLSANRTITVSGASQAEAEAGSDNTKAMTPLRTAQAIAALASGGGGTMSDPKVIYVRSDGNDGTAEIGNPAKPFLTGTAAWVAGTASSVSFGLDFGFGTYSINLSDNGGWTTSCKFIRGKGHALTSATSATYISFSYQGNPTTNDNAGGGGSIGPCQFDDFYGDFYMYGGNVTADDSGTYTAGNGGDFSAYGTATVNIDNSGGGDNSSTMGVVNAGSSGSITLDGFTLAGDGSLVNTAGTPFGGSAGGIGAVFAKFCRLDTGGTTSDITTWSIGSSSVPSAFSGFTDKGGNSTW